MKKLLFFFFLTTVIICNNSFAQTPTLQQKLYYTCKAWGFTKYFHYNVSMCNVNWDSVLLHVLPMVITATDYTEFNDALDTLLTAAGPITFAISYFPDTLAPELKRNLNFGWMTDSLLRADNQAFLLTVKNNFRPHTNCYVQWNSIDSTSLVFPDDNPVLNITTYTDYPDESHRLLLMFKYWNIINYFDPYNYVLDKPIDTVLFNNVLNMDTASDAYCLYLAVLKIAAALDDLHTWTFTYSSHYKVPDLFVPDLMIRYIQGKYIVVRSGIPAIPVGDAIVSVNGITTTHLEDSLIHYSSAGNMAAFHWLMAVVHILPSGYRGTMLDVVYADTSGAIDSAMLPEDTYLPDIVPSYNYYYYPADSLYNIKWTKMDCGIGYINTANLSIADADSAYKVLYKLPAIIIDLRSGTSTDNGIWALANSLTDNRYFAKFTVPDVTYPGTFFWELDTIGLPGNPTPYNGTVVLLINEETWSHTEFASMAYSAMPKVIKIGSQTAGSDGDADAFQLTLDLQTAYTCVGVYYPNGDSTQRIGIVPDSVVTPTIAGIMQGRDEVLEKAIQVACIAASATNAPPPNNTIVTVYPNPANDAVTVEAKNLSAENVSITIADITGRILLQKNMENTAANITATFDIKVLSAGMYFVNVDEGTQQFVSKIVKE